MFLLFKNLLRHFLLHETVINICTKYFSKNRFLNIVTREKFCTISVLFLWIFSSVLFDFLRTFGKDTTEHCKRSWWTASNVATFEPNDFIGSIRTRFAFLFCLVVLPLFVVVWIVYIFRFVWFIGFCGSEPQRILWILLILMPLSSISKSIENS